MTLNNLRQPDQDLAGPADFLARAEILHALGFDVLVSRFGPFYQLADYLSASTDRLIGIALGVDTLNDLFDEQFSKKLDGGALSPWAGSQRSVSLCLPTPTRRRADHRPRPGTDEPAEYQRSASPESARAVRPGFCPSGLRTC
jgi:hypothetical protein